VQSEADVHAMAQYDPDGYARAISYINQARSVANECTAMEAQQSQAYKAQFNTWARKQDEALFQKIPELKDERVFAKVKEASLSTLEAHGISAAEATQLWSGEASLSLRDARAQAILVAASERERR
jgi:hypothetical protein